MATQTETATQTASTLTLDPPKALQVVEPQQAAGLVPLKEDQKSQLEERVEASSPSWSRSIPTRPSSARRSTS
jgi:hypothetical protein